MGNVALVEALETLARELAPQELTDHLLHAKKLFETLREFRNYYMHSASRIGLLDDGKLGVVLEQLTSRRRVSFHKEGMNEQQLAELLDRIHAAANYVRLIWGRLVSIAYRDPAPDPPLSSREMPPLPDRLKKPRLFLQDDPDQL